MHGELELARAIKGGSLDLICPEMELLACPHYRDVVLKGTGVIRSDRLGRLYFRMVAPFQGQLHAALQPSKAPGEIYSAEDHLILRAVDENGLEWRSNWIVPRRYKQLPLRNWRIGQNLATLFHSSQGKSVGCNRVEIIIPNAPELAFDKITETRKTVGDQEIGWTLSRDSHTHRIGETEVSFRCDGDRLVSVVATQRTPFLPDWPGLLCHAIGFVTAQTVAPAVIVREFNGREDISLFSGPFRRLSSFMPGPVRFDGPNGADDFWRLLELFFKHIELTKDEKLLDELDGIRRGACGSFQTACLTLGIGIESIATLLLKNESVPKVCPEAIKELGDHIERWPGDAALKKRVKGVLTGFKESSAADRMYAWAKRTGAAHTLIDAWKKLRHPKAHGRQLEEGQKGYDLYYSSIELMYRIVASAIGYHGTMVPTSRRGWRDAAFRPSDGAVCVSSNEARKS